MSYAYPIAEGSSNRSVYNIRSAGALGNGSTDDTAAFQRAIDAVEASGGGIVYVPGSSAEYRVTGLTLGEKVQLLGDTKFVSLLKLLPNSNAPVVKSRNFDSLTGGSSTAPIGLGIANIGIDGNSANNSTGNGISFYAARTQMSHVDIKNTAEQGFYHECGGNTGETHGRSFMLDHIIVDSAGKHGFWIKGPSDGEMHECRSIDASTAADNTYDGLYLQTSVKASHCHTWNRSTGNRHRYALNDAGEGSFFDNCYFEGGKTAAAYLNGTKGFFTPSCRFSASAGGVTLIIDGTEYAVHGYLGTKLSGAIDVVGLQLGVSGGWCADNLIVLRQSGQEAATVDFTQSDGGNIVHITGYNGGAFSTSAMIGTPHSTDEVYIRIRGTGSHYFTQIPTPQAWTGALTASGTAAFSNASISMTGLPTSNPGVTGRLWNNSGVLTVSA